MAAVGLGGLQAWLLGLPTALIYGSLALFISILHNVFLLYYVDTFVSVYKINKVAFWVGEVGQHWCQPCPRSGKLGFLGPSHIQEQGTGRKPSTSAPPQFSEGRWRPSVGSLWTVPCGYICAHPECSFIGMDHTQQCSGAIPGSALRNPFW